MPRLDIVAVKVTCPLTVVGSDNGEPGHEPVAVTVCVVLVAVNVIFPVTGGSVIPVDTGVRKNWKSTSYMVPTARSLTVTDSENPLQSAVAGAAVRVLARA
jgi:hypothetical protein